MNSRIVSGGLHCNATTRIYLPDSCGGPPAQYSVDLGPAPKEEDGSPDLSLDSEDGLKVDHHGNYTLSRQLRLSDDSRFLNPEIANLAGLPNFSLLIDKDTKVTVKSAEGRYGERSIERVVVTNGERGTVVEGAACNRVVKSYNTDHAEALDASHDDGPLLRLENGKLFPVYGNPQWTAVTPMTPEQFDQVTQQHASRAPSGEAKAQDLITGTGLSGYTADAMKRLMGPRTAEQVLGARPTSGQTQAWSALLLPVIDKLKDQPTVGYPQEREDMNAMKRLATGMRAVP